MQTCGIELNHITDTHAHDLADAHANNVDDTLNFDTLNRRLSLFPSIKSPPPTPTEIGEVLVKRGIAFQYQVVITRRPSWMP